MNGRESSKIAFKRIYYDLFFKYTLGEVRTYCNEVLK